MDLSKFLSEKAVASLVTDMKSLESVPTDSLSLETFFHAHGVNMRYLGRALNMLKKSKENKQAAVVH